MDYLDNYKYKILDRSALKKVIEKNSKKTFVMCHGVFDIVHPGHLRHLANAKSKADFLIVSIT
jgi:bifunctional ADP-heptose synthase (sugar kinase/adenylyltransferase)